MPHNNLWRTGVKVVALVDVIFAVISLLGLLLIGFLAFLHSLLVNSGRGGNKSLEPFGVILWTMFIAGIITCVIYIVAILKLFLSTFAARPVEKSLKMSMIWCVANVIVVVVTVIIVVTALEMFPSIKIGEYKLGNLEIFLATVAFLVIRGMFHLIVCKFRTEVRKQATLMLQEPTSLDELARVYTARS